MKKEKMKSETRKFIHWSIIFPLLSIGATIYGVIYLKNLGIDKTDIMLGAVMGVFITFIQFEYYLSRVGK
jgi:hypothetical protein